MQTRSVLAFFLLIAKVFCDETTSTLSGTSILKDSIPVDAITIPSGQRPTLGAPLPDRPVFVTGPSGSIVVVDPTSRCIELDCPSPTGDWVTSPTSIGIVPTASPVGLFRGGTHVKIVERRQD
ncbi:hypothetical protein GY45DRAFT_1330662 [Cubamyces sp. BRFM 1775]|nr:hypothetical protein GY45DRAFT_1330662 [Cubamyces sp. BRFM 1775]